MEEVQDVVKAPDFQRSRINTCYYARSEYELPSEWIEKFRTENGKENAVAQLKHALINRRCNVEYGPIIQYPRDPLPSNGIVNITFPGFSTSRETVNYKG